MRGFTRGRAPRAARGRDQGAVAVLVALVLAFAMIPAVALGTGTYVRSATATELQRSSDSGALAGAASIPLANTQFVSDYLSKATLPGGSGVLEQDILNLLNTEGLTSKGILPPLAQACATATADAKDPDNLAHSYATIPAAPCTATYLANDTVLSDLTQCVATLAPGNVTGLALSILNSLLGTLGLGNLDATLGSLLPALLDPGVQVTMTWKVKAPFDSVFGSNGSTQTSTSIARRRFKNVLVLPVASLPVGGSSITINANSVLQPLTATVFKTLTSLESLLSSNVLLKTLLPGVTQCVSALQAVQSDLNDLLDPPSSGPDLTSLLQDAATSQQPVLALLTGTGIPFLDFVPVCIAAQGTGFQAVTSVVSNVGCVADAPGAFRASLRSS